VNPKFFLAGLKELAKQYLTEENAVNGTTNT
jgi:hypothetical protein